jgi:outer membrane protein OmpA-like peptidoglycan-associated protein
MNNKLSQDRADSVLRYLTSHGIEEHRLEAHGFGPSKPIDTNETDAGRQKNRRVEFHITQQGAGKP